MVINNLRNVDSIGRIGQQPAEVRKPAAADGKNFESLLRGRLDELSGVKFSKHALDRMTERGISLSSRQIDRLNAAIEKAERKGLKESLVMVDDLALVVSVKNRTVITVTDRDGLRDNVFTNIDGAVFS
jgi:flagellar operon protein